MSENVGGPNRDGKFIQTDWNVTFTSTGQQLRIPGPGNFLRIVEASADLEVKIDSAPFVTRHKGHAMRVSFGELVIMSNTTQTVQVVVGFGWLDDNTSEVITSVGSVSVSLADNVDSETDVTLTASLATAILAAKADSKDIFLTASINNTETVRVGKAGDVAAGKGIPLEAGQTVIIEAQNVAIEGYAVGAGQIVSPTFTEVP